MPDTTIQHSGTSISGYLAEPAEVKAGLIVIQEWWGLTDDIKAIADDYAKEGYLAFAPDLYHGAVASEPDEARKLAMAMERDTAAREVDAVIAWMKDVRSVGKVGCVGYCMGGGLSLAAAIRPTSNVDAVHIYYGGGMPAKEQIATIRVPVAGSYGSLDGGIPAEQVDMLRATLEETGVPNEIVMYEGAEHGFFNNTRPAYHPEAAADSWKRSLAWFGKHLQG